MAVLAERRKEIVTTYRRHDVDTGSPEVQIAMLTSGSRTSRGTSRTTTRTITAGAGWS